MIIGLQGGRQPAIAIGVSHGLFISEAVIVVGRLAEVQGPAGRHTVVVDLKHGVRTLVYQSCYPLRGRRVEMIRREMHRPGGIAQIHPGAINGWPRLAFQRKVIVEADAQFRKGQSQKGQSQWLRPVGGIDVKDVLDLGAGVIVERAEAPVGPVKPNLRGHQVAIQGFPLCGIAMDVLGDESLAKVPQSSSVRIDARIRMGHEALLELMDGSQSHCVHHAGLLNSDRQRRSHFRQQVLDDPHISLSVCGG